MRTPSPNARIDFLDGGRFVVLSAPISRAALPTEVAQGQPTQPALLTPAERDVAARLVEGASFRDIARARGVSAGTVSKQVTSIYRKFGVHSRSELAALVACGPQPWGVPPAVRG